MDIKQLKYFIAVADERNFTRASEILHIAQPPLSRQIQLLEAELGVELISRNQRPLRLTEAGRAFYEQAQSILRRVEHLKTSTKQIGLNQRQQLSIGFVASTLYGGLPSLVRKMQAKYPELDIQLIELTSMEQIQALKSGRIDIGFGRIRSQNAKTSDQAVTRIVLREERLALALAPCSPLAQSQEPIKLQELNGQKLIVYPRDRHPSFADHVLGLLKDWAIYPVAVHEVQEIQTALGLVAADYGICLIPASAKIRNDLTYRLISDTRATSPIILTHRINDNSWYIETIKNLIADIYKEKPSWLEIENNLFPQQ